MPVNRPRTGINVPLSVNLFQFIENVWKNKQIIWALWRWAGDMSICIDYSIRLVKRIGTKQWSENLGNHTHPPTSALPNQMDRIKKFHHGNRAFYTLQVHLAYLFHSFLLYWNGLGTIHVAYYWIRKRFSKFKRETWCGRGGGSVHWTQFCWMHNLVQIVEKNRSPATNRPVCKCSPIFGKVKISPHSSFYLFAIHAQTGIFNVLRRPKISNSWILLLSHIHCIESKCKILFVEEWGVRRGEKVDGFRLHMLKIDRSNLQIR